jgi:hypothetical protein
LLLADEPLPEQVSSAPAAESRWSMLPFVGPTCGGAAARLTF